MNIYNYSHLFLFSILLRIRVSPTKNLHSSSFDFDGDKPNTLLTQIIDLNARLSFHSKEKKRAAEITHLERPLKDYVVRLDRINPFQIK